jgi:hypothetical protein
MRRRYRRAGRHYKSQRVTQLVERFGYDRKAALRAERAGMNAFAVRREVDRQLQAIEAARRGTAP